MNEAIRLIIEDAVWAPSGSNSQPWRFEVSGDTIDVHMIPDRDHPILNYKQGGTYIAHGALIENIVLSAMHHGYTAEVLLFPEHNNANLTARISMVAGNTVESSLYPFIRQRVTNRKAYADTQLTETETKELEKSIAGLKGASLVLKTNKKEREIIGKCSATMERIALEMRELHRLFFEEIIWRNDEQSRSEKGLPIQSLELPPPARVMFRALKHWPIARALNTIGFSKIAASGNAATYAKSAAAGAIIAVGDNAKDFITAGRAAQRVWLTGTKLGLSFQPITGLVFMARRFEAGDTKEFEDRHIRQALGAYRRLKDIFGVRNEAIAFVFRIGHGTEPTSRSSRSVPHITEKI
ncbi:MAG: hypothetical protein COW88_00550 [Candidatus Lloydbacteria bacterium CG22_combo_CG10-13_8_21_14_all_47_15]|uniref:Nitroreductase domain-containing protein n=1 Tax=Candidatus Lloydbacteria bacterium CG22_combo_CG10-13_8_21_14_all_47_15 TaxID=1974635 RepID=A0A2H0CWY2_9BACT|nr:MAG: hypothetical protein COW88_00550 [Candidatus Lloydbacteria bacterium CG22_combo_CG10-13_8_21_14_all_47_15]